MPPRVRRSASRRVALKCAQIRTRGFGLVTSREVAVRLSPVDRSHGRSFLELFKEANGDFYAIDKHLFSPAVFVFQNLKTGNTFTFGELVEELAFPG